LPNPGGRQGRWICRATRFRRLSICRPHHFGIARKAVFGFASHRAFNYVRGRRITPKGFSVFMIVCSCNVLSDDDVRNAVSTAQPLPRNAKQIYGCLGCSAECGRCARTIKTIIDEALGACAKACCSGCPHSQAGAHQHSNPEFALAAS
jgi:bacterioferritin-associated ferredoxin